MNFKKNHLIVTAFIGILTLLNTNAEESSFDATSINSFLDEQEYGFALEALETYTAADKAGTTTFFSHRKNKQLPGHWLVDDPQRADLIPWIVDATEGATASGLGAEATGQAISRAFNTWESERCSEMPIVNLGDWDENLGFFQYLLGYGDAAPAILGITHGGWLPKEFFDELEEDGGDFILAVTVTFSWRFSDTGELTDLDNNGRSDVALREIYYNDAFHWAIDDESGYDVETVALHEAGHALSQDHFGRLFRTEANGRLHFAPRSVMNAGYTGIQQELTGTDRAGHCSIWASWPNR